MDEYTVFWTCTEGVRMTWRLLLPAPGESRWDRARAVVLLGRSADQHVARAAEGHLRAIGQALLEITSLGAISPEALSRIVRDYGIMVSVTRRIRRIEKRFDRRWN